MPESQEALDKVKELLTKALILVPSTDGEPLLLLYRCYHIGDHRRPSDRMGRRGTCPQGVAPHILH
jgi:hypothetical protein